jgi:hypothetical protein
MHSHQTVALSRGRHNSPDDGACVMELASMLAGERWTDRPRAVCPVIAAVLRGLNDGLADERRQGLIPYASEAVGTSEAAARESRRRVAEEFFFGGPPGRFGRLLRRTRVRDLARAAYRHARTADERGYAELLGLVERLIAARPPVAANCLAPDEVRILA